MRSLSLQRVLSAIGLAAIAAVFVAILGAHLGFGPLHGKTALRDVLFGDRGRLALVGSTTPGAALGGGYGSRAASEGSGGSAGAGGAEAAADGPQRAVVKNLDDFFDPEVIRIGVGGTVEFRNTGRNPHTVTADDGSFDSGVLTNGQAFERTYDAPGAYPFNCRLHGAAGGIGMAGVVLVGDVELPSTGGAGGVGPGRERIPNGPGATIHVPGDGATIQEGVNIAEPGDLVLVEPGVYREAVLVRTPYLTIRGTDRNAVVLDGELKLPNGIHVVEADGVTIENMTARHYQLNGFYWSSVNGYRGSYLTAYGNGDYGVYAFDSTWGRFDHSYASGHPDSGFYIGQCHPCHAVIDDVVSTHNALGYSGTNAGGDLAIVNSEWTDNLAGIAPNTLDSERLAPQRELYVAGNWVHDNAATDAPTKRLEWPTYGIGIIVAGGRGNTIEGNLVVGHPTFGIALLPNLDDSFWATRANEVRDNVVRESGRADLALGAPSVNRDCFAGNAYRTSMPPLVETLAGCDGRIGGGGEAGATFSLLARFAQALGGHYPAGDWQTEPPPPDQPQMRDATTEAPVMAIPESAVPGPYTVRSMAQLEAVAAAAGPEAQIPREVMILGIPVASGLTTILGLYGYVLPLVLYASWVVISLLELVRRDELGERRRLGWMAVVLIVPFLGPVIYLFASGSSIARPVRLFLVVGGMAIYLAVAAAAFLAEAL